MALIKCSEFGKEISDRAKSCPECGYTDFQTPKSKNNFRSSIIRWMFIIIVVICLVLLIKNVICSNQKQNDINNANNYIDNLINTVSELSDIKLYNNSNSYVIETDVDEMKKYVDDINSIYGKYDIDVCNAIDSYIKNNTDKKSWNDYIIMLSRDYYLLEETDEAVKYIMGSGSDITASNSTDLKNFDQIENGMTEKEVINILGQPSNVNRLDEEIRYDYGEKATIWFNSSGIVYKTKLW